MATLQSVSSAGLLEAVLLFVRVLERMSSRARKQCGPAWAEISDAVQAGRQDDLVRVSFCQIQQCCFAHSRSEIAGMWEGVCVCEIHRM